MASEWASLPLEDCMEAIIDYRGKSPTKTAYGVPLVTAKIVKDGRVLPPEEYIAESDYESWMRRGMPRKGDIVMTTEAPLGEVAQLDGRRVALAQRIITLRGKPELLDNTFLKFLLQSASVQDQLRNRSTGTTVLGIRQSELRMVTLTLPTLLEQKRIAHILGTLDDKIELNRRMNATLEAMSRAIFKSWFVDFDPVRQKAAGKQPVGIDAKTAALFPNSFEDSKIGPLPAGWKHTMLSDMCSLITDGSHQSPKSVEAGLPMASVKDMTDWEINTSGCRRISVEDFKVLVANGCQPQRGDILLAKDGATCLDTACEYQQEDEIVVLSSVAILRPKHYRDSAFIHTWLGLASTKTYLKENFVSGSAIPRVVLRDLRRAQLISPPRGVLDGFSDAATPLREHIRDNHEQSRTLAALRDTLLPKLLSGELRVPEAEQTIEEATA